MAIYESEHTKFMREWMAKNPAQRVEQQKGRALWWDQPQDVARTETLQSANVPQSAYVYQTK